MRQIIAIDGPSGSGKTTVAKLLAKELGYSYLDTGALYRAVALALRNKMIDPDDGDQKLREALIGTTVTFRNARVFLNGEDVSGAIRSREIDHYSSVFSTKKIVRDFLLDYQRNAALQDNLVVEGRDTTTVVFPGARKKIFLDASVQERARRRHLQYSKNGIEISMEEAVQAIIERDKRDAGRNIAPLVVAHDAFFVDSSNLSVDQVKNRILDFVRNDP